MMRRKVNYQKGVDAAERALGLANPAFIKTIMAGEDTDAAWKKPHLRRKMM